MQGVEDEIPPETDTEVMNDENDVLGNEHNLDTDDVKPMDEEEDLPDKREDEESTPDFDFNKQKESKESVHGIVTQNGAESIKQPDEEEIKDWENTKGEGEEDETKGGGELDEKTPANNGTGGDGNGEGEFQQGEDINRMEFNSNNLNVPNPFRDPGDAEQFWHRKLNMVEDTENSAEDKETHDETKDSSDMNQNTDIGGTFEFASKNDESTTQVLSGVNDADVPQFEKEKKEPPKLEEPEISDEQETFEKDNNSKENRKDCKTQKENLDKNIDNKGRDTQDIANNINDGGGGDLEMEKDETPTASDGLNEMNDSEPLDSKVVTDLDQLKIRKDDSETIDLVEYEDNIARDLSLKDTNDNILKWSQLQAETGNLSRRLCEKLRLVMEPLVATKLRGDYRTGKRINMKRVIGYIASGFRKDKIWLRRTKPAKRDYRVLIAVDDSESMDKSGTGKTALKALATIATGMSQLEIGELAIASFGEEMKLLHPFHTPFTSECGLNIVSNFKFRDKRTRTALCVESVKVELDAQTDTPSKQLVIMISDGRIERDSRAMLRKTIREMHEKNILLMMIIVEGNESSGFKKKDSIVNMKEVTFENGKPKFKHFIDDYPFPYYIVLEDMDSLPEVLGSALSQWFEIMAQNECSAGR